MKISTPHSMVLVLIAFIFLQQQPCCQAQRQDQTYISIHPVILQLNKTNGNGPVIITCRQLPFISPDTADQLKITKTDLQGGASEDILASRDTGNKQGETVNKHIIVRWSVSTELVVTLREGYCEDAYFNYTCFSRLSSGAANRASATLRVQVPPPRVTLRVSPQQDEYTRQDVVTLTCSSPDVLGMLSPTGLGRGWRWQYNDVGGWVSAPGRDVSGGGWTADDDDDECFYKEKSPSVLRVRLSELKQCHRMYRCFPEDAPYSAREHLLSLGDGCDDDPALLVLGTNPVVAIISVIAAVIIFLFICVAIARVSQLKLAKLAKEKQQEVQLRILSPMTPEQRHKLLQDKLKTQGLGGAQSLSVGATTLLAPPAPPPPQPLITMEDSVVLGEEGWGVGQGQGEGEEVSVVSGDEESSVDAGLSPEVSADLSSSSAGGDDGETSIK